MASSNHHHKTRLDRSIQAVLHGGNHKVIDESTPSRRMGLSAATERLHRLHGTSLLARAIPMLSGSGASSCYATACTLLHRFYHCVSLQDADVWSAAMAATLVACKIEEITVTARQVILVFSHLYQRRCLLVTTDNDDPKLVARILKHPAVLATSEASSLTLQEKKQRLDDVPAMSPMGPVWKEWMDSLLQTENHVLRALGFSLHWIPDHHPHKYLAYCCDQLLEDDDDETFLTRPAWKYCNASLRMDLCVRYESPVIACAAIYLAALDVGLSLPPAWWESILGKSGGSEISSTTEQDLSDICNAILGVTADAEGQDGLDVLAASLAFIRPEKDSFNGPDSFLWYMLDKKE